MICLLDMQQSPLAMEYKLTVTSLKLENTPARITQLQQSPARMYPQSLTKKPFHYCVDHWVERTMDKYVQKLTLLVNGMYRWHSIRKNSSNQAQSHTVKCWLSQPKYEEPFNAYSATGSESNGKGKNSSSGEDLSLEGKSSSKDSASKDKAGPKVKPASIVWCYAGSWWRHAESSLI